MLKASRIAEKVGKKLQMMVDGAICKELAEIAIKKEVAKQGAKLGGKAAAKVDMVFHMTEHLQQYYLQFHLNLQFLTISRLFLASGW